MSRSEDDEKTPLVYEDRVSSSSAVVDVDAAAHRRRRNICVAMTTVCLGVGLVLAVALPFTLQSSSSSSSSSSSQGSKEAASNPVSLLAKSLLQLNAIELPSESVTTHESNSFSDHSTESSSTTDKMHAHASSSSSSSFGSSSSSSSSLPSSVLSENSPTTTAASSASSTASAYSSSSSSSSSSSDDSSTTSPPDPFVRCNGVPQGRRSAIDVDQLNGRLLFELYRVQTRNSPGYARGLSCSVMELDFGSPANDSVSKEGTMKLKWTESGFISRYPKSIDVKLERSQESSNDWTETFSNESNAKGQLSLLAQLDGYLLTYECFPNATSYYIPRPAYAIHLYSMVPRPGNTYAATFLMNLANIWGLNPAEERPTTVSHRFCSLQNTPH